MDLAMTPGYVAGLPDVMNLRELGGLQAADGRRVRHGLLYRASALSGLSPAERELVDGLGLRLVLDLRAAGEAAAAPDYVPDGCEYLRVGGMVDADGEEVDFSPAGIGRVLERIGQLEDPDSFMRDLYVSMALGGRAVRVLMERLSRGQLPLLFHCTAGKDRTGVCAALVLMALGVPDGDIMRDFLLTNEYRREIIENCPEDPALAEPGIDRDSWAKANGVQPETLEAVFSAIDGRHRTREAFLQAEFGLGADSLAELRARCLR